MTKVDERKIVENLDFEYDVCREYKWLYWRAQKKLVNGTQTLHTSAIANDSNIKEIKLYTHTDHVPAQNLTNCTLPQGTLLPKFL